MSEDTNASAVNLSDPSNISEKLKELNKDDLVRKAFTEIGLLIDSFKDVIDSHSVMFQTDGTIIGTGKADFTQGNTTYVLSNSGKKFHLIDVPGIEGNESKYEAMVKQAVAKAHLVFYVNGTNKKPEKVTADKIKSYLNRGTQVCPLLNVRGNADSYEFEEDRVSLNNEHNKTGLTQTTEVLEQCIGEKRLLPAHCVQGLLAFSSLAKTEQNISTIHFSRENDLIIQQRNFLKNFHTYGAMKEFSGIKNVANVLENKAETFREDIVESNKEKVKELLNENSLTLNSLLSEYQSFSENLKPEFSNCKTSIEDKFDRFKQSLSNERRNLLEQFFSDLTNQAIDIVASSFGDEESISRRLKRASNEGQENLEKKFSERFKDCFDVLLDDLKTAMARLIEDIQRVEFQTQIENIRSLNNTNFQTSKIEMGFDLKDFGKFAFNIASYTASGFAIGSAFGGPVGAIIGSISGAVVGIFSSLLSVFTSKDKRIRKAQSKLQKEIEDARDVALKAVNDDLEQVINDVNENVISSIQKQIDILQESVDAPNEVITQQIKLMTNLSEKVEAMPYGTIQAV